MSIEWRAFNPKEDEVPKDAIRGGVEPDGEPLYVARSHLEMDGKAAGVHPGKYGPETTGKCVLFGYDGKEAWAGKYEILCGDQNLVKWIEMKGSLPEKYDHLNLVEGGQDAEGRRLFCAQVEFKGSITPGKLGPHMTGAIASFAGLEWPDNQVYNVLAYVKAKEAESK